MKFLIPSFNLIAGLALLCACNNSSNTSSTDSTAATTTDTTRTAAAPANTGEQDFLDYAVPANTKEIIWLKAGINHGTSKALKDHARMMLKDHEKLDGTVKNYLSSHSNLHAPTVDTTNVVNINDKKGKDWDMAWTDKMVTDHSDLLDKLKNSQNQVKDTALLSIINSTIPVVNSHLTMVKDMQSKMK